MASLVDVRGIITYFNSAKTLLAPVIDGAMHLKEGLPVNGGSVAMFSTPTDSRR